MQSYRKAILFILLFCGLRGAAQDINFSQFYDLPLLRNPALAGIFNGDFRMTAAYRNQWQAVTTPYRTMGLGIEYKRAFVSNSDDYITYGMQISKDVAGDSRLSRTQVFPVLNYHKSLSGDVNRYISAAFMAGPVMQQFDPSKLQFDDQFQHGAYSASNPTRENFSSTRLTYWDPSVGILYSSSAGANAATNYYVGVGIYHFTKPKVAFQPQNDIRLNPKYVVNFGLAAPTGNGNTLILYGDLFTQGGSRQGQGGLMFSKLLEDRDEGKKIAITGGMFYRMNDALVPMMKLDYLSTSIGVSYDINLSKLTAASQYRGGFEVTLSFRASKYQNGDANMVRCPRFF